MQYERTDVWTAAALSAAGPEPYRLGPEDSVIVTVLGHPEFSGEFVIPADGTVSFAAAGSVRVAGKTTEEFAQSLTERLKERLRDPEVSVFLKSPRVQRIYVTGSVKDPGAYEVKPGWGVAEALAAAGGLAQGVDPADCKAVVVRAATGERETVDLAEVLRGDGQSNVRLGQGDLLMLDSGEMVPVYVMGKVKNPGLYRVKKDDAGVMAALTLAGGVLDDAATSSIRVEHLSGDSEIVDLTAAIVTGRPSPGLKLCSGDLVVVPETTSRIAVLGFVNKPGFYTLRDGRKVLLSDALGMAGGPDNKRAGTGAVAVIRTEEGKQTRIVCDLRKFLKEGDASQNPEIKPGDVIYVPPTDRPDWDAIIRSVSSIGLIVAPYWR